MYIMSYEYLCAYCTMYNVCMQISGLYPGMGGGGGSLDPSGHASSTCQWIHIVLSELGMCAIQFQFSMYINVSTLFIYLDEVKKYVDSLRRNVCLVHGRPPYNYSNSTNPPG